MSDCGLVTKDMHRVRRGEMEQRDYESDHAVYLTRLEADGVFEMTAIYCPNFVTQNPHCYVVDPEDYERLRRIHSEFSNEAYPLGGDKRRDLHQRLALVLECFIPLQEGEKV